MGRLASARTGVAARLAGAPALAQRRPVLAAIALGLIAACAYPPLHLWPLGLAALAGFVWLIHTAPNWRSAPACPQAC